MYTGYPCDAEKYDDFLFILGFQSMVKKVNNIEDLECVQLYILLDSVNRFNVQFKDSTGYADFLNSLSNLM